jgi:heme-degrading monooxygenase HmoA
LTALTRMEELATEMPGYVSHKAYVAQDGERLTLFEWESAETLRAWATHPEHVLTKQLGRERFYEDYHLQVCEVVRESRFERVAKSTLGRPAACATTRQGAKPPSHRVSDLRTKA